MFPVKQIAATLIALAVAFPAYATTEWTPILSMEWVQAEDNGVWFFKAVNPSDGTDHYFRCQDSAASFDTQTGADNCGRLVSTALASGRQVRLKVTLAMPFTESTCSWAQPCSAMRVRMY